MKITFQSASGKIIEQDFKKNEEIPDALPLKISYEEMNVGAEFHYRTDKFPPAK